MMAGNAKRIAADAASATSMDVPKIIANKE